MKAVILHGVGGHKDEHPWFGWLDKKLTEAGFAVWRKTLPDAHNPIFSDWQNAVYDVIESDTVIIGHSLGVPAALRAIEEKAVSNLTFCSVAGMITPIKNRFESVISRFCVAPFDWKSLRKKISKAGVFHSADDPYVPIEQAKLITEKLNGERFLYQNRGHLGTWNNAGTFPELLDFILKKA